MLGKWLMEGGIVMPDTATLSVWAIEDGAGCVILIIVPEINVVFVFVVASMGNTSMDRLRSDTQVVRPRGYLHFEPAGTSTGSKCKFSLSLTACASSQPLHGGIAPPR